MRIIGPKEHTVFGRDKVSKVTEKTAKTLGDCQGQGSNNTQYKVKQMRDHVTMIFIKWQLTQILAYQAPQNSAYPESLFSAKITLSPS